MCGLSGVIVGRQSRTDEQKDRIRGIFTQLLSLSEHRGPFATGVALVKMDGSFVVEKAPIAAMDFVKSFEYESLLSKLNDDTTLLMGHTRWPTIGSHHNNENNQPLLSQKKLPVLLTHNGHIGNFRALFAKYDLARHTQVDSEILLRFAERNIGFDGIQPQWFVRNLKECEGRLSAVILATEFPNKIFLVKGNQPLEMRYNRELFIFAYASENEILDKAIAPEEGWEPVNLPAWHLVTVNTQTLFPLISYPFSMRGDDK